MSATMNISLPPTLKEWVETQVSQGGFKTTSAFFRQLLRDEQRRRLRSQIDERLHQALDSGPSTPMTTADWDRIRHEGQKRLAARKRKRP